MKILTENHNDIIYNRSDSALLNVKEIADVTHFSLTPVFKAHPI